MLQAWARLRLWLTVFEYTILHVGPIAPGLSCRPGNGSVCWNQKSGCFNDPKRINNPANKCTSNRSFRFGIDDRVRQLQQARTTLSSRQNIQGCSLLRMRSRLVSCTAHVVCSLVGWSTLQVGSTSALLRTIGRTRPWRTGSSRRWWSVAAVPIVTSSHIACSIALYAPWRIACATKHCMQHCFARTMAHCMCHETLHVLLHCTHHGALHVPRNIACSIALHAPWRIACSTKHCMQHGITHTMAHCMFHETLHATWPHSTSPLFCKCTCYQKGATTHRATTHLVACYYGSSRAPNCTDWCTD
jgi:hypothetical protein